MLHQCVDAGVSQAGEVPPDCRSRGYRVACIVDGGANCLLEGGLDFSGDFDRAPNRDGCGSGEVSGPSLDGLDDGPPFLQGSAEIRRGTP